MYVLRFGKHGNQYHIVDSVKPQFYKQILRIVIAVSIEIHNLFNALDTNWSEGYREFCFVRAIFLPMLDLCPLPPTL